MSVYLHDIPLPEAQARLKQALLDADLWRVLGSETIPLDEHALGRVTAESIWAKLSSPHYHASAMDGFAVRAVSTDGALPSQPITLEIESEAEYVDTGDPLPAWANAVIPIENVEALDEHGGLTRDIRDPASIKSSAAQGTDGIVVELAEDPHVHYRETWCYRKGKTTTMVAICTGPAKGATVTAMATSLQATK